MGYVKKAYRKIFNELDYNYCLPDGWDDFVDKQTIRTFCLLINLFSACKCIIAISTMTFIFARLYN